MSRVTTEPAPIIAPSPIHNADKIIVVDHGRIAEQGTHAELMARGGIYAKLIELQSFE